MKTDELINTAFAGIISLKVLETGMNIIDKNKKKVKNKGWL
jgi:hypothetical protein